MTSHSKRTKYRCSASGKRRFRDHREAVVALHQAANHRARAIEQGEVSRRREVRSYRCKKCKGWHLTSAATPPRHTEPTTQRTDAICDTASDVWPTDR